MTKCSRCGIECKKTIRIEIGYNLDGSNVFFLCDECNDELNKFFNGQNLCKCKIKNLDDNTVVHYAIYHNGHWIRKTYTEMDGSQK